MTRKAFLEIIQHRLKPGDNTTQMSLPYIEGVCDLVWEQMALQLIKGSGDHENFYSKEYSPVTVTLDATTGRYYSDLPEMVVRDGIDRISQIGSRDNDIIPISDSDFRHMASLEVYQVGGNIYYYYDYYRVYYGESMTSAIAAVGVTMDLIIPFSKFDIDEQLPMPQVAEASFVDAVIGYLSGTPLMDLLNTNKERA
jgi:hypothetical protein